MNLKLIHKLPQAVPGTLSGAAFGCSDGQKRCVSRVWMRCLRGAKSQLKKTIGCAIEHLILDAIVLYTVALDADLENLAILKANLNWPRRRLLREDLSDL